MVRVFAGCAPPTPGGSQPSGVGPMSVRWRVRPNVCSAVADLIPRGTLVVKNARTARSKTLVRANLTASLLLAMGLAPTLAMAQDCATATAGQTQCTGAVATGAVTASHS